MPYPSLAGNVSYVALRQKTKLVSKIAGLVTKMLCTLMSLMDQNGYAVIFARSVITLPGHLPNRRGSGIERLAIH